MREEVYGELSMENKYGANMQEHENPCTENQIQEVNRKSIRCS